MDMTEAMRQVAERWDNEAMAEGRSAEEMRVLLRCAQELRNVVALCRIQGELVRANAS